MAKEASGARKKPLPRHGLHVTEVHQALQAALSPLQHRDAAVASIVQDVNCSLSLMRVLLVGLQAGADMRQGAVAWHGADHFPTQHRRGHPVHDTG